MLGHEIDLLITPDPTNSPDLIFVPVIDYELILVTHECHPLAMHPFVNPEDQIDVELITVPVSIDRLDVYSRFLLPANCTPRHHRPIAAPALMLPLVAAGRGGTVLHAWLVAEAGAGRPTTKQSLARQSLRR